MKQNYINSKYILVALVFLSACTSVGKDQKKSLQPELLKVDNNPVIKDIYTADPAAMVYDEVFYLYTGHDEQQFGQKGFLMNDWYIFSTTDMVNWTNHGPSLNTNQFEWAKGSAWAAHVVEKNGKFYWYVTLDHAKIPGMSIGVAVGESPTGPFTDALGKALVTNDMTKHTDISWDDIDPAVFIDDDGTAYLYWGNTVLKYAKLKSNMIELDGPIMTIDLPAFTEGPWVFKKDDKYYLTYSAEFPEVIDYAMASSPEGPWEYKGRLNDVMPNSPTNHQGVLEFKGNWYFVYHDGSLPQGGEFRRSVCIDYQYFNDDGTMKKIDRTPNGVNRIYK
ncbi:MAG: glycoside hydrolase family 43 protein [Reichenbachiella sp.]